MDIEHQLQDVVTTTIDIAATPERVFEALTDPEELAAWWGSEDTYRTRDWSVDARPGGAWSATTVDSTGREGSLHGECRIVDAPRLLEYGWRASWDDAASVVRYELSPQEVEGVPGTRLTVTHTGPADGLVACTAMAASLHRRVWSGTAVRIYSLRAPRWLGSRRHRVSA
jgi:uncharacterized protein YndB with AHSA1/START domain